MISGVCGMFIVGILLATIAVVIEHIWKLMGSKIKVSSFKIG